ncbi:hypothetical protein IFM89_018534 [Coptis chinensis]|uniref:Uncharacterized protein n=1 Tax=Coptis chinensis TaxID=261450 RepID=A0A835HWR7_9MAGN|nr:hypothetical protein IFM89_018534 [Coptis chinensis]
MRKQSPQITMMNAMLIARRSATLKILEEPDLELNSRFQLFSSSRLDELVEEEEECLGGGGIGFNGGGKYNGGDGVGDGFYGFSDSNENGNPTDSYYQKMIQSNPGNSLILGNYVKFLKDV